MKAEVRTRGQPLLVFAIILGGWLVGRVLLWAPPFPILPNPPMIASGGEHALRAIAGQATPRGLASARANRERSYAVPRNFEGPSIASAPPALASRTGNSVGTASARFLPLVTPTRRAAGHQMLLAAAFANGSSLAGFDQLGEAVQLALVRNSPAVADRLLLGTAGEPREGSARRLSGDAWLYWREGSADAATPGVSSYGRSQAGAVMRYRLLSRSSLVPAAYARVTRTLEGARQEEVAGGITIRPLAQVPVSVAAEVRVTDTAAGREVRPGVFAVTQLPPLSLPLALRGEAYLQAGYVGGRFSTAFVDGQARIDRRLARMGEDEEIRVGLAVWGGAQERAARLDVGPTAALGFKLGVARARIAADYRLRVAGGARPASGPAVTFSAGF